MAKVNYELNVTTIVSFTSQFMFNWFFVEDGMDGFEVYPFIISLCIVSFTIIPILIGTLKKIK